MTDEEKTLFAEQAALIAELRRDLEILRGQLPPPRIDVPPQVPHLQPLAPEPWAVCSGPVVPAPIAGPLVYGRARGTVYDLVDPRVGAMKPDQAAPESSGVEIRHASLPIGRSISPRSPDAGVEGFARTVLPPGSKP